MLSTRHVLPAVGAGAESAGVVPDVGSGRKGKKEHGRERAEVEGIIADLGERNGITGSAHDVLFSLTRFKQNGARYA